MKFASAASLVFLCVLFGPTLGVPKTKVVNTVHGKVEGSLSNFGNYYEFVGMRYAMPVRFRAPAQPPSYSGVFKASARNVACAQPNVTKPFVLANDNEDCLVVNVFTPANFTKTSALPVMAFIHGGDFERGSSSPSFYGPRYLVSEGVIAVTFNYRLNVYGFLNLGLKEAPGNAGLKDIRAALRWVQNNIEQFGGNAKNVTVFGQGSGGTSAIYLTLSPTTRGLFQRIIVESGTLFTKDSYDPKPIETAEILAKALGEKANSPKELLNVLNKTAVAKVMSAIKEISNVNALFAPSLESVYDDEEPFLIDTPYNILATGLSHPSFNPVPMILGHTNSEVLINMIDGVSINNRIEAVKKGDLSSFLHRSINPDSSNITSVLKDLKATYLKVDDNQGLISGIFNFETDFLYTGPMSLLADLYSESSKLPVYSYVFDYVGERNVGRRILSVNSTISGTTHFDELYYLMELESSPMAMSEDDSKVLELMISLWTNFAKYGMPSPPESEASWAPHPHRLSLSTALRYVVPADASRAAYWRNLYFLYGSDIRRE